MCILCGSSGSETICYKCRKVTIKGKEVGEIDINNKVYFCKKDYNRHFFFKFHGWGISSLVLRKLLKINNTLKKDAIEKIRITVVDRYKPLYVIETPIRNFLIHGKKWVNEEWDEQYILHESYFTLVKAYDKHFEDLFKNASLVKYSG